MQEELTQQQEIVTRFSQNLFKTHDIHTAFWETLTEIGDIPLAIVSGEGKFLDLNSTFASELGYTIAELLNIEFTDISLNNNELKADIINYNALLIGKARSYSINKTYINKKASLLPVRLSVVRLPFNYLDKPVEYFIVSYKVLKKPLEIKIDSKGEMALTKWQIMKEFKGAISFSAILIIILAFVAGKGAALFILLKDLFSVF